jgi:RNA polymerase sigma-70 factor (ECF subfamily)
VEYQRFAALVTPHTATMARVAAALVGEADAEDAAQEALLRAWDAWPALRDAAAVRSWLLRVTVNVCRNWLAGHFGTDRQRTEPLRPDAGSAPHLALAGPGTVDHAERLDLRAAVMTLDDDLRYVVALRFYVGLDATEIGAALAVPPPTVRTRLRRALMLLRERLGVQTENQTTRAGKGAFDV